MSHLKYFNYPGVGENNKKNFRYSQAVRIGDKIECSGQGMSFNQVVLVYCAACYRCRSWSLSSGLHLLCSIQLNPTTVYRSFDTDESGGWVRETGEFFKEINAQIDQAFENCQVALETAGGKGWSQVCCLHCSTARITTSHRNVSDTCTDGQVYRVNSYHVPINNEAMEAMVRNSKKWMPDHEPLWTCVGVPRLGEDDMRVEIEVWAHVSE
jgi:enamine deaminase RidA (YjgF/YER057c/UK114 family)